jgi:hypothetical protein
MDLSRVERMIADEYRFLVAERPEWSLVSGPQDLELVAHAFRVLLHTGSLRDFRDEYHALVACQHADGGWAPRSNEPGSTVWVSAFCALMQIRGNRILADDALAGSVRRAIDYFLDTQKSDGRWVDPRWADLDTTSHPVSFFNVVLALGESHRRADVERSWRDGLGFILDRQTKEGGWHDPDFHPSGVEITAHLIQDALVASLVLGDRVPGIRESCQKGLAALRGWQAANASWDDENVDHTMDCVRSSMVVTRILGDDPETTAAIERGLDWIVATKNAHGWGDFPGMETNLERTCDGIDVLCKYRAFRGADPMAVVRLWGYVP